MKNLFKKLFYPSVPTLAFPQSVVYQLAINMIRGMLYCYQEEEQEKEKGIAHYERWQHHYVDCFGCLENLFMDLLKIPASYFEEGSREEIAKKLSKKQTHLEWDLALLKNTYPHPRPIPRSQSNKENKR